MKFTGNQFGGKGKGFKPGKGKGFANTKSAAFRKQVEKYVACMRENGYDLPEPNLSGKGSVFKASEVDRDSAKYKKASAACTSLLPEAGG